MLRNIVVATALVALMAPGAAPAATRGHSTVQLRDADGMGVSTFEASVTRVGGGLQIDGRVTARAAASTVAELVVGRCRGRGLLPPCDAAAKRRLRLGTRVSTQRFSVTVEAPRPLVDGIELVLRAPRSAGRRQGAASLLLSGRTYADGRLYGVRTDRVEDVPAFDLLRLDVVATGTRRVRPNLLFGFATPVREPVELEASLDACFAVAAACPEGTNTSKRLSLQPTSRGTRRLRPSLRTAGRSLRGVLSRTSADARLVDALLPLP